MPARTVWTMALRVALIARAFAAKSSVQTRVGEVPPSDLGAEHTTGLAIDLAQ